MNDLIPLTEEQAKAVQEVAKATGQGIELVRDAGRWFAKVLGTVPEDFVGYLGGDALKIRRMANAARRIEEAQKLLTARQVESQPPPLELLRPVLEGAASTEQPELADLWSRLLAAAMDPYRVGQVRQSIIDTVKAMDPMDALVLNALTFPVQNLQPSAPDVLSRTIDKPKDEVEVSLLHLIDLSVLRETTTRAGTPVTYPEKIDFTAFGRVLVRLLQG